MANYIPASVSSLKNYGNVQDFYSAQNLLKHLSRYLPYRVVSILWQKLNRETENRFGE